jgi:Fur family ferric uptake transcriptional regulator
VILEELRKRRDHPSARELYEVVRRRLPRISLGTVYRNLDLLSSRGEAQKITLGRSESRFDGNPSPHYHVRCVRCGRVGDVPDELPPRVIERFESVEDYKILGFHLELLGICPECQSGEAEEQEMNKSRFCSGKNV